MNFDKSYIDVAFINARVITVNDKDEISEAVGIKKNKIVFVGTTKELLELADDTTKIIDLKGKTLMPGLIDSHFHPIFNGFIGNEPDSPMRNIDSTQCRSIKELQDIIKEALKYRKKGEWVSSLGYEPMFLKEKRHPTLEDLDEVAPDNPVQCFHVCGHICVYNSKALETIGVYTAEDAKKFPKDEIEVKDGKLTGMVRDNTCFLLWSKVGYTYEQQRRGALKSQMQLLENGVTSVHDCGACDAPSYHIMMKMCREGEFKVREYMFLHSIYGKKISYEDNEHWMSLGLMSGLGDEHFKIGGCKFMIDGGSSGPSSATREPYSHDPTLPGVLAWTREETAEYIEKINNAECQATAHAIGDLAIEFMVEGYEKAFEKNPRPDLRHRIEHCTVVDKDLVDRMAKMNICPTLNSGMFTFQGKRYAEIYGEKRAKYFIALRSMLDAGMKPAIASDSPSGPMGLSVIDGAVNRYDYKAGFQFDKTQAISLLEAIRCATLNGAYASYEDDIKGSIEVGKLADMIVLDRDILSIDTMDIKDVRVDMTMIDGETCYEREGKEW